MQIPGFSSEIARNSFAHQCAKASKFCAISTQNLSKSFRNFCMIFMQIILTGNPRLNTGDQKLEITVKPFLTIETYSGWPKCTDCTDCTD